MKEKKRKNGCNFVIMTFTNLEKYVYSKNDSASPTPPSGKVEGIFTPKSLLTFEEQPSEEAYRFSFLLQKLFHFLLEIALSGKSK